MTDLQTKLGGGLNRIQNSLQQGKQKLKAAQEISQYKREIQEISESRGSLILKLGEDVYRKIRTGELQDSQLHEYFLKIAELDRKIYRAQKSLELISLNSETKTCPHCGATIERGDKFCGSCGRQQEEMLELNKQVERTACPNCEEQIPVNISFCPCCGSHLML